MPIVCSHRLVDFGLVASLRWRVHRVSPAACGLHCGQPVRSKGGPVQTSRPWRPCTSDVSSSKLTRVENGSGSADEPEYLRLSLREFLNLFATADPAPAGGSAAALAVSLAAGLCAKAARLSRRQLPDAAELAAVAEALRDRAASLSQADAAGYGRVISAQRSSRGLDPFDRRRRIDAALLEAAETPTEIAELGAKVGDLAAHVAEDGNPNLLGDVVTAALLAEAGVASASALVMINLEGMTGDARLARVSVAVARSTSSAARARRS